MTQGPGRVPVVVVPLEEGLRIGVQKGVVELTASLIDPHQDNSEEFMSAVSDVLFDHQYQAMTDAAILDPDSLRLVSCVVSRDPIPESLKDGLLSLGFAPVETEGGGREQRSVFARFSRSRRSTLDRWQTPYLRAEDVSTALGELEACLVEDAPFGAYAEIGAAGTDALINAARTAFRLLLTPGLESLERLERHVLQERSQARGRLVLHPAVVRCLTCFVGETVRAEAPASQWSTDPDDDAPLWIRGAQGAAVSSDPELRVVRFIVGGRRQLLTAYVESVLEQARV